MAAAEPEYSFEELYEEARRRGLFKDDPDMQRLGHEARRRGLVTDPTQGGLFPARATAPQVPAPAAPSPLLPAGQAGPRLAPPALGQPGGSRRGLPVPVLPDARGVDINAPAPVPVPDPPKPLAAPVPPKAVPLTRKPPKGAPTFTVPTVTPFEFSRLPEEDAYEAASRELEKVPAYLRTTTPKTIGELRAAEAGRLRGPAAHSPVRMVEGQARAALAAMFRGGPFSTKGIKQIEARLNYVGPRLVEQREQLDDAFKRYNARVAEYNKRAKAGSADIKERVGLAKIRNALAEQQAAHQRNQQAFNQRAGQFNRYIEQYRLLPRGEPLHSGAVYPQETITEGTGLGAALAGSPVGRVLSGSGSFLNPAQMTSARVREGLPAARNVLQLTGEYPALPPLPRVTPEQQAELIRQKNAVLDAAYVLGDALRDDGTVDRKALVSGKIGQRTFRSELFGGAPDVTRAMRTVQSLTPWQRQLLPVIRQQLAAERKAHEMAGLGRAVLMDAAAFVVGAGVGTVVGGRVAQAAYRKVEPWLAQPAFRAATAAGTAGLTGRVPAPVPKAVLQALSRPLPALLGATAGGATAGGTVGFGLGLAESQGDVRWAAKTGIAGAKTGAVAGLAFGAVATAVRGATAQLKTYRTGETEATVARMARTLGERLNLAPEEVGALQGRLLEIAKAPKYRKNAMRDALSRDLHTGRVAAAPPPKAEPKAKRPPAQAKREEAPRPAPVEPTVATADGTTLPIRRAPASALRQAQGAAEAAGDTATAANIATVVARHAEWEAAHQVVGDAVSAAEWKKAWNTGDHPQRRRFNVLDTAAGRTDDPALKQALSQAAADAQRAFGRERLSPDVTPPPSPTVSAWRTLTDDQQIAVAPPVRHALLRQDIENSAAVLGVTPDSLAPAKATPAQLERAADEAFARAQETAAGWVAPAEGVDGAQAAIQPEAVGVPAAGEPAVAPGMAPTLAEGAVPPAVTPALPGIAERPALTAGAVPEPPTQPFVPTPRPAPPAALPAAAESGARPPWQMKREEFAPIETDPGFYESFDLRKSEESVFRGITADEAASIARTGQIKSTLQFSHPSEGTSFSDNFGIASSAVNFGRTSAQKTGKPNYVIEVQRGPELVVDPRDKFPKAKDAIPAERIVRAWKFNPDETIEVGLWTPQGFRPHKELVRQALREDKPVPPEVLSDYPDLAPKAEAPAAPKPEKAPPAQDRRSDLERRKAIEELVPEERRAEVERIRELAYRDQKTGLLNENAWADAEKGSHVAELDADGLGWINDNYGHAAGDELLRTFGRVADQVGLKNELYRTGGDEFHLTGDDPALLQGKIDALRTLIRETEFTATDNDGQTRTFKGLDFSYGIGKSETAADKALYQHKGERREAGERAAEKGGKPPRLVEVERGRPGEDTPGEGEAAAAGARRRGEAEARPVAAKPARKKPTAKPKKAAPRPAAAAPPSTSRPVKESGRKGGEAGTPTRPLPAGMRLRDPETGQIYELRKRIVYDESHPLGVNWEVVTTSGDARTTTLLERHLREYDVVFDPASKEAGTPKQRFLREFKAIGEGLLPYKTPTYQNNVSALLAGRTGQPVTLVGFRQESPGGRIPGTGTFWAVDPTHAGQYAVVRRRGDIEETFAGGPVAGLTVSSLQLTNPLYVEGGHRELVQGIRSGQIAFSSEANKAIESAWAKLKERGEPGYALLDKAIASAARTAGYDAVIYRKDADGVTPKADGTALPRDRDRGGPLGTDSEIQDLRQLAAAPKSDVDLPPPTPARVKESGRKGGEVAGGLSQWDAAYPRAGDTVDGRTVPEGPVPNTGSISASLDEYTILPGIREVKMWDSPTSYYAADDIRRTKAIAEELKESGWISPLIVVIDKNGPYILEGGHRFDALGILKAKSFPALVVLDDESLGDVAEVPETGRKGGEVAQTGVKVFLGTDEVLDEKGTGIPDKSPREQWDDEEEGRAFRTTDIPFLYHFTDASALPLISRGGLSAGRGRRALGPEGIRATEVNIYAADNRDILGGVDRDAPTTHWALLRFKPGERVWQADPEYVQATGEMHWGAWMTDDPIDALDIEAWTGAGWRPLEHVPEVGRKGGEAGSPPPPEPPQAVPAKPEGEGPRTEREPGHFESEGMEQWSKENRRPPARPERVQKGVNDWLRDVRRSLTRVYRELGPEEHPHIQTLLTRLIRHGDAIGYARAQMDIARVVGGLTPEDQAFFTKLILIRDLQEDIQARVAEGETDIPTPRNTSIDQIAREFNLLNEDVKKAPKVAEAFKKHKELHARVSGRYEDAMTRAMGKGPNFWREDYYRRLMLDEARRMYEERTRGLRAPTKRGFLQKRTGKLTEYSTDYVQSQFDYLSRVVRDTLHYELLAEVRKTDITRQLYREAMRANDAQVLERLSSLLSALFEFEKAGGEVKFRADDRFQSLAKLATEDALPDDFDGRWSKVLEALAIEGAQAALPKAPMTVETWKQVGDYLKWLLEADTAEGDIILQAVRGSARRVKKDLGKDHVTIEDLLPEGYKGWTMADAPLFEPIWRQPEVAAEQALTALADAAGIPAEERRSPRLILPEGLADVLNRVGKAPSDDSVSNALRQAAMVRRGWTWWTLYGTPRVLTGTVRDIAGNINSTIALNPHALTKVKQATSDIVSLLVQKVPPEPGTPLYEAVERGLLSSLFANIEDQGVVKALNLLGKHVALPADRWDNVATLRAMHQMPREIPEIITRYAHILSFNEQVANSPEGLPNTFGASRPGVIQQLPEEERGWRLGQDVMVNFDEQAEVVSVLRALGNPFARFIAGNTARYWRAYSNAFADPRTMARLGFRLAGRGITIGAAVYLGKLAVQTMFVGTLMEAWNRWRHPEEEKHLPPYVRNQPHVIFNNPITGETMAATALSDFPAAVAPFGAENARGHVEDILNGRKTFKQIGQEMAKDAVKAGFSLVVAPEWKGFAEGVTGMSAFPDPFDPHPIPGGTAGRVWHAVSSLVPPARDIGVALRGAPDQKHKQLVNAVMAAQPFDVGKAQYDEVRGRIIEWKKEKGKGGPSGAASVRGDALYQMRVGVRFMDTARVREAITRYELENGTLDGLKEAAQSLNPFNGMDRKDLKAFIGGLSPLDREKARGAVAWYASSFAPHMRVQVPERVSLKLGAEFTSGDADAKLLPLDAYIRQAGRAVERSWKRQVRETLQSMPETKRELRKNKRER